MILKFPKKLKASVEMAEIALKIVAKERIYFAFAKKFWGYLLKLSLLVLCKQSVCFVDKIRRSYSEALAILANLKSLPS